jgi:hypothetical protein
MPLPQKVMIIECIKEGFILTHKNWQLVLLRMIVALINIMVFFIFIGLPIFITITYLDMDITHAKELLPYLFKNPLEFISRYLGLVFLIAVAFIFYLVFSSLLFLYALSGILGVLKDSAVNIQYRFNLSSFFKGAKKYFFPLFWLICLLLPGFIIMFIIFIVSGGIGVTVLQTLVGTGTRIGMFFNLFFILSIIVFGTILLLTAIVFIVYSVMVSVIEEKGVLGSIKRTFNFLKDKPVAFLFYIILLIAIITANLLLFIIETPFNMIPVMKPLINVAFYLINTIFQSYLSIVLWSSLLVFYIKSTNYPVHYVTYDI